MPRRLPERAARRRAWRTRRAVSPDAGEPLGHALLALLAAMGGSPERAGLQRLWDNWVDALGEELADMAQPLGHRSGRRGPRAAATHDAGTHDTGAVLLVGAGDAMLLQELRFRGEEILARVNAFLGHAYFSKVQVSLPLGRTAPVVSRAVPGKAAAAAQDEPAPAASGRFLESMDSASPVARCYACFVRRATKDASREASGGGEKGKVQE